MRQAKLIELMDDLATAANMADQMEDEGTQKTLAFHLRTAQNFLYEKTDWRRLIRTFQFDTVAGQRFYDYPTLPYTQDGQTLMDTPNPRRIQQWTLQRGTARYPVYDGINQLLYNNTSQGQPWRVEPREQIEVFQEPDGVYTFYIEACIDLRPFRDKDDRCTCDANLIMLLATASLKGNWNQLDAGAYAQQAVSILRSQNADNHGNRRYIPGVGVLTPTSPISPLNLGPWPMPEHEGNWSDW